MISEFHSLTKLTKLRHFYFDCVVSDSSEEDGFDSDFSDQMMEELVEFSVFYMPNLTIIQNCYATENILEHRFNLFDEVI
jgi:hypothetical protein